MCFFFRVVDGVKKEEGWRFIKEKVCATSKHDGKDILTNRRKRKNRISHRHEMSCKILHEMLNKLLSSAPNQDWIKKILIKYLLESLPNTRKGAIHQ